MDFFEAVEKRYSHKERFLPDPVPVDDLKKIAKAGLTSPTGNNSQNVKIVILPDREAVKVISDIVSTDGTTTAPAAVVIFTDKNMRGNHPDFDLENYSAATQNVLLAATALGYSSLWLDYPFIDTNNQQNALKALNAPDGLTLRVFIPIGKPDGEGSRRSKIPLEERLFYKKFS